MLWKRQEHISTRGMSQPAQLGRHALTSYPRTSKPHPSPCFFSPALFGPTFEMRQTLQLGLGAGTHHPNATSNAATTASGTLSAGTSGGSARKSAPPQNPGTTSIRLQAILAKNREDTSRISPYSHTSHMLRVPINTATLCLRPPPRVAVTHPQRPLQAKISRSAIDSRPLLGSHLPSRIGPTRVPHVGRLESLPEAERALVSQETLAAFITDPAEAYAGDTTANYVQCVRVWHVA